MSVQDADDALVSMAQAGDAEGRRIARTHLARSLAAMRERGLQRWAAEFEAKADLLEADRSSAAELSELCAAARARHGIDGERDVLQRWIKARKEQVG